MTTPNQEDREMLEMAARAAGYEVARVSDDGTALLLVGRQEPWNPLTDDGDTFRLAVELRMEVSVTGNTAWAMADEDSNAGKAELVAKHSDPYAATRRAIVRAAASIGERL